MSAVFINSVNILIILYLYYHQMIFVLTGAKPEQTIIYVKHSSLEDIIERNNILPAKIFMILREERTSTGE
jgi:hypothetical protein